MFDVVVKNASLAYGRRTLFSDISFTLKGGEWTCLLGGSGVGKTSLLRLIAGLCTGENVAASGHIACEDGFPLKDRITWMAQQDLLLPWLTAIDNVTLGLRLRRSVFKRNRLPAEALERAEHILYTVGLDNRRNDLPQSLSGGQRQRVALARTLMENRPVVLMDEPFGALDAVTRLTLQDLASELLGNRTVFLITHDPLEALRLGHQVYHLRGSPARLTNPLTPPGSPLRSPNDKTLIALHGEILNRLRHEEAVS